ncbi:hypothetical protein MNR02_08515 [Shinella sp. H4-D48]|uniref:hypothetical protein n=1 Tax=Shinella sp. H4-D48 TaxID=2925841 RepID=UPI001F53C381|nr:hypothetical protein [Shinella sp. H4-D48]UNK36556.1 hypothetical protein MNR02_08515 [Shinella sp. H4-D48]
MAQPVYQPELACAVHGLSYDFTARTGILVMAEDHCADMAGAIALFQRIDPEVNTIATIAGGRDETRYRRRGSEWVTV